MTRDVYLLICPVCKQELVPLNSSEEITCTQCANRYPLVNGKIAILLEDPSRFLANLYLQYEQHLRQQRLDIDKIDIALRIDSNRSGKLSKLQTAIQHNANYVKSIQDCLERHVSPQSLTPLLTDRKFVAYETSWAYLQRDWCWLPEGETELHTILSPLFTAIRRHHLPLQCILVVGAGTGRIAWELCEVSNRVYAIDNALTMAYQFFDLLDRDISFFEVNRNNILHSDDLVRPRRASLYPPNENADKFTHRRNKLSYLVADALNTPLRDHSMSAILSVYFTDLVPMKAYIQEIKRLLKPGGIFFHFGPLEYDLPNVKDQLSADEIKSIFRSNNFRICEDKQILSTHLPSKLSMSARTYNNWVFATVNENKADDDSGQEITLNSILQMTGNVYYDVHGRISTDEEQLIETNLILASGEKYGGARSVLDILRIINGSRRNHEIIDILARDYDLADQASKDAVLDVIATLVQKKVLRVVEF